jgi:hypothetical protein
MAAAGDCKVRFTPPARDGHPGRRTALVGDVDQLDTGITEQHLDRQLDIAVDPGRAVDDLSGPLFRIPQQIVQRLAGIAAEGSCIAPRR